MGKGRARTARNDSAKDDGAKGKLPPAILFSARRPSGRTLAASLLAIGLADREHNAVLADWGFDQSPLMRYFDAEHLAVVYSKPAQEGIFVTPRLALFSASHFSDDDSAAAELGRLEARADVVVVSCATTVPAGLKRRFSVGFAVFDYTEESVSEIDGTLKAMAAVCDKVLALPSRVDLGFPQLASWRGRAKAALANSSATGTKLTEFELPFVAARAGLFDLPGKPSDDALEKFVSSIVKEVSKTCRPASSPKFIQAGNLPSLQEAVGEEVRFIAPPPLSRFQETERIPEKVGLEPSGEEASVDKASEEKGQYVAENKPPVEEQPTATERQPSELEEKPEPPSIRSAEDTPVPGSKLEAWAGFDPVALKERHEKTLREWGFLFDGKDLLDLFARMNRSLHGWSVAKSAKLWKEKLVHLLWLADEARKGSHRVEMDIRERIESVFKAADKSQMSGEHLRVVRVLNLIGLLKGSLAGGSVSENENAEKLVVHILGLTPDSETAQSERLLQLRRLAQGLALALPSLQTPESESARKSFEHERDKLPPEVLRLIPGMKDVPDDDGEEDSFAPIDIRINPPEGEKPANGEMQTDDPEHSVLASRFPLDELQKWADFDVFKSAQKHESALKREGFVLPAQGKSPVEAYASFNLKYRIWSGTHRRAHWGEASMYCLALAELARARGESSIENNIRDRAEEIIALASDSSAKSESVRIIRVLNLIGSLCSGLEAGGDASLKKAEKALIRLIEVTSDSDASDSETLLQLRRIGLGIALRLPLMKTEEEEEARAMFEKERDLLPDKLRRLLPSDDIREKIREIREKVEELV